MTNLKSAIINLQSLPSSLSTLGDLILFLPEWLGAIAVTMLLTISPRFKRRPLLFVYPQREAMVAATLVVLTAALLWLFFPGMPSPQLAPPAGTGAALSYSALELLRQLSLVALSLIPFALALLIRRQPLLSAGLGKQTRSPSIYLGIAIALMALFLRGKVYALLGGVSTAEAYYLVAMLGVSFAEEFIFRGYVQLRLGAALGERWGWIAAAGLYTLFKLPQRALLLGVNDPVQIAVQAATLLISGLIYGWIMTKSGNVLAPALYHAVHEWASIL